jgi:hypothetical protein
MFYYICIALFRLEAGKFDSSLIQSIQSSRNFVLVLTSGALDRCINDTEQKDWIHKEVACALNSDCNIIPVFDNFSMPKSKELPVAMRPLTSFNGVNWVHDYQNACMDKIARFMNPKSLVVKSRKQSEIKCIEFIEREKNLKRHSICTEKIERTDPEGMANEANISEV